MGGVVLANSTLGYWSWTKFSVESLELHTVTPSSVEGTVLANSRMGLLEI
jgi:hypothetical protein